MRPNSRTYQGVSVSFQFALVRTMYTGASEMMRPAHTAQRCQRGVTDEGETTVVMRVRLLGVQSGVGRATLSMTTTSNGPFDGSSLKPVCSCNAVKNDGPSSPLADHFRSMSNVPVSPVRSTTGLPVRLCSAGVIV